MRHYLVCGNKVTALNYRQAKYYPSDSPLFTKSDLIAADIDSTACEWTLYHCERAFTRATGIDCAKVPVSTVRRNGVISIKAINRF